MSELSYLEKLLDGAEVEWLPLSSLCNLITTGKLNANAMEDNGAYPFFTCNEEPYRINTYAFDLEAILISGNGSQVGHLNYYNGKFNAYQRTYILGGFNENVDIMYLYYYLMHTLKPYIHKNSRKGSVPYITMPMLENFKFPIPCPNNLEKSLAIQSEIVRILDKFTALTAELTAELNMRKKQYNYYRDQLLSFEQGEVEWKTLGEITTKIASGRNKTRDADGKFPVYGSTGLIGFIDKAAYSGDLLLVARVGAYAGLVNAVSGHFDVSDNTLIIHPSDSWNVRFAFHQLRHMNLNQYAVGAGQPLITGGLLKNLKVPFPSLKEQTRIAKILDKFETITASISEGLPREIELRQKQYEYYRDLLFSFPKPDAVSN
ncbi:TPA: restriction endonuclease subunit S [Escherichia coli]|nr:restriction endonuclease subunit S [Escherichia coli]